MKRTELVEKIYTELEAKGIAIDFGLLAKIFEVFLSVIKDSVVKGERIELRGFGTFLQKKRNKRIAWNPSTKQNFEVPGKSVPYFKPGTIFKKEVRLGNVDDSLKGK